MKLWRTMAYGEPNVWKTSVALDTAPRPICWIHAPGEGGYATLVETVRLAPDRYKDVFIFPLPDATASPATRISDVEKQVKEAIKRGPQSIIFEGIDKLQPAVMDVVTEGKWSDGVSFDGGFWTKGDRRVKELVDQLRENTIPLVHLTCWEAEKAPYKSPEGTPKVIRPDLNGKFLKNFMGMGFMVFRQFLRTTDKKGASGYSIREAWWRIRGHQTLITSFKGPRQITDNFPEAIPADFRILFDTWDKLAAKEASA